MTKDGFQMSFLKKIVDKISIPLDTTYDYIGQKSETEPWMWTKQEYKSVSKPELIDGVSKIGTSIVALVSCAYFMNM